MTYSIKSWIFLAVAVLSFAACKKSENKIIFEGGESPQLTASVPVNSEITLDAKAKSSPAISFNWTNPKYTFNTGVSSQNVSYTLQVDTVGAGFASSTLQEKSVSNDLSWQLNQEDLNKMLLGLNFPIGKVSSFEVRVKAALGDGSVPVYSNVLTFMAAPFLDVVVPLPTSDKLFIVGGGPALGGWNNGGSYATQNQEFTKDDATTFSITVELAGGDNTTDANQFLFVPVWGSWDHKYACKKTADQSVTGGKFGFDWSDNFPGPPEAGTYKIVVDFKKGVYTVTKL